MLKLTNSFCRYLPFTCDNVSYNSTHVKRFTYLNCTRKKCSTEAVQNTPSAYQQVQNYQQLRLQANVKRRLRLRTSLLLANELNRAKQMSESLHPTENHVCYGVKFEIKSAAAADEASPSEYQKNFSETGSMDNTEMRTSCNIPPDFRVWEPVDTRNESTDRETRDDDKAIRFKVVSYNVLAQYLLECHPYLYSNCSPRNLKWKFRASRLYNEIMNLAPDILCLQEVQASHLSSFYAKFEKNGYYGIFKQKTGHRYDGCAIYFKQSLFTMEDHVSVEFFQPELPLLNRDNIGVMVKLVPKNAPESPFVVATTHLLYNPKRTDVRLAQIQVFLAEIDRFAYYNNGTESGHLPIILTGDMNSTPNSAVVKLLARGYVSAGPFRDSSDWKKIGVTDNCQHLSVYLNRQMGRHTDFCNTRIFNSDYRSNPPHATPDASESHEYEHYSSFFNSGHLGHSLKLTSVYDKVKPDGHYEATTFQDYWITVDYIFFSCCSNLKLVERLRLPTTKECEVLGQLPNGVYGSDHLSLGAIFEIKPVQIKNRHYVSNDTPSHWQY